MTRYDARPVFADGEAAREPLSLNVALRTVLVQLEQPSPNWAVIDAVLQHRRHGFTTVAVLRTALTKLAQRAPKEADRQKHQGWVATAAPADEARQRALGYQLWPELCQRLIAQHGADYKTPTMGNVEGRPAAYVEWLHAHEDGPQKGKPVRCWVEFAPDNGAWVQLGWTSWSTLEGQQPANAAEPPRSQELDAWAEELFGGTDDASEGEVPSGRLVNGPGTVEPGPTTGADPSLSEPAPTAEASGPGASPEAGLDGSPGPEVDALDGGRHAE